MYQPELCVYIDGCVNKALPGRFLCRKHRDSTKNDGTRDDYPMYKRPQPPRKRTPITKACDVDECDSLARSNVGKYCGMHDARMRHAGTTDESARQRFRNQALIGEDLTCTYCGETKPAEEFGKRKGPTGNILFHRRCDVCRKRRAAEKRDIQRNDPNLFVGTKICIECKEELPRIQFDRSAGAALGLSGRCKHCRKNQRLLKQYGITVERFNKMLAEQDGVCAICQQGETKPLHWSDSDEPRPLSVDHNHSTGEVRALLCSSCNVGLGYFKDDTELMANAIEYIERFK